MIIAECGAGNKDSAQLLGSVVSPTAPGESIRKVSDRSERAKGLRIILRNKTERRKMQLPRTATTLLLCMLLLLKIASAIIRPR